MQIRRQLNVTTLRTPNRSTSRAAGISRMRLLSPEKLVDSMTVVFDACKATKYSTKIAEFLKDNEAVVSDKLNDLAANGKISFDTSGFSVASVADNVNKVLLTIRLLMGISIAVLIAFALFSSFRFHLNNKVLSRMRYFSEKIKNGEYDELTDEEKQERIDLIKKHYGKYDKEDDEARIAEITATAKAEVKAAEGENQ